MLSNRDRLTCGVVVGLAAGLPLTIGLPASAQDLVVSVPGSANPWLAGMPDGTSATRGDAAPMQSPVLANVGTITEGMVFWFAATGETNFGIPDGECGPEGGCWRTLCHLFGSEHGISDYCGGLSSLLGVFLDDEMPSLTPAPPQQEPATRDLPGVSPLLKQVFHIGDGRTTGGVIQGFRVPAGATRLFLGTMDEYGWANNTGVLIVTISSCVMFLTPIDDKTVCPRGEASFDSAVAGPPETEFRWQMERLNEPGQWDSLPEAGGATPEGFVFAGVTTPVLNVRPVTIFDASHQRRFRCVVTSVCLAEPASSNPALLRVALSDVNCDGFLDFLDFADFVACIEGSCLPGMDPDFNGDGFVDAHDLSDFIAAFEAGG